MLESDIRSDKSHEVSLSLSDQLHQFKDRKGCVSQAHTQPSTFDGKYLLRQLVTEQQAHEETVTRTEWFMMVRTKKNLMNDG